MALLSLFNFKNNEEVCFSAKQANKRMNEIFFNSSLAIQKLIAEG